MGNNSKLVRDLGKVTECNVGIDGNDVSIWLGNESQWTVCKMHAKNAMDLVDNIVKTMKEKAATAEEDEMVAKDQVPPKTKEPQTQAPTRVAEPKAQTQPIPKETKRKQWI